MFNSYGSSLKKVGGSLPIWLEVNSKITGGGVLRTLPPKGSVVPSGTPVILPKVGGVADALEFFRVDEAVAAAGVSVKILARPNDPIPAKGAAIMKVPDTLLGTGTAATVSEVALSTTADGYRIATLTISVTLGKLAVGDILTLAAEAGDSKGMKYTSLSGFTENDIYVEEDTTSGTCAVVDNGRIMADRIQAIPAIFRALVPTIKFEEGI